MCIVTSFHFGVTAVPLFDSGLCRTVWAGHNSYSVRPLNTMRNGWLFVLELRPSVTKLKEIPIKVYVCRMMPLKLGSCLGNPFVIVVLNSNLACITNEPRMICDH